MKQITVKQYVKIHLNLPVQRGRADFQPQLHQRSSVRSGERQQVARRNEAKWFTVFARFCSVELGRQFIRLKNHGCMCLRLDRLNVLYPDFLNFALFVETIYDLA